LKLAYKGQNEPRDERNSRPINWSKKEIDRLKWCHGTLKEMLDGADSRNSGAPNCSFWIILGNNVIILKYEL